MQKLDAKNPCENPCGKSMWKIHVKKYMWKIDVENTCGKIILKVDKKISLKKVFEKVKSGK